MGGIAPISAPAGGPPAAAVDRALDAAQLVMQNGGASAVVERAFRRTLRAHGVGADDPAFLLRIDLLAVSIGSAAGNPTFVRRIGPIGINLSRVSQTNDVTLRAARGELAPAALEGEFARIRALPSPYGRWTTIVATGAAAAGFARFLGGDWGSFGLAFVAAMVGQALRQTFQARGIEVAPTTMLCALVSAFTGALGVRLGLSAVTPATLIGSVVYMVPGLALILGFVDLVTHRYLLVGVERMLNAGYILLVLAIAVAIAGSLILSA